VLAVASVVVAASVACSGGGGSGGGAGGGTPADRCEQFISLTNDCYSSTGSTQKPNFNPAACSDPSALDPQMLAEIDCAVASPDAYCKTLGLATSSSIDASAAIGLAKDPEVIKLNACVASSTTASPCKEAINVLANCGVGYGFATDCPGPNAALAKCINDNPTGACAAYTAGQAASAEAQAFQKCQIDATRALLDAGAP
jgi:hypothetical protein